MPSRIIGIAPGDPLAVTTFSGISRGLFTALERRGVLAAAVDGRPSWVRRLELVLSADVSRARWRQRFDAGGSVLAPTLRAVTSRVASQRAREAAARTGADATLQLTGRYGVRVPGLLSASFHDGNLAAVLQRPDLLIDADSAAVRRALRWERELYDSVDRIFTMSEWLRGTFIDTFGQPAEKVVVAGGGTDLELPADVDHPWERPCLLFVGREWERKGGPELLAAWPAVRAALPEARLVIVGPPKPPKRLPPGVEFRGRIDRSTPSGGTAFGAVYREATAFVLPSRFEPFGVVLLEAMAYGLPCVVPNRCAMPEIVADGTTGKVVEGEHPEDLSAALVAVLDAERGRQMGAAGRARLEERFTWDAVADRVLTAL